MHAAVGIAAWAQGAHPDAKQMCQHHTDGDPEGVDSSKRVTCQLHTPESICRETENFVVCTLDAGRVDAGTVLLALPASGQPQSEPRVSGAGGYCDEEALSI